MLNLILLLLFTSSGYTCGANHASDQIREPLAHVQEIPPTSLVCHQVAKKYQSCVLSLLTPEKMKSLSREQRLAAKQECAYQKTQSITQHNCPN